MAAFPDNHCCGGLISRAPLLPLLFALRDLLVFFGIACSAPKRNNEATQLLYLALAYWLVPAIARLAGAGGLASLLRPQTDTPLAACLALVPQVLIALFWARRMWRARMGESASP